jgi:hypothetical protein
MNGRRIRLVVLAVAGALTGFAVAAVLAGCGEEEPKVASVTVTAPADGSSTRESRITVRGTVTPANAQVTVMGRNAQVANGVFTVSVPLKSGNNDIDVLATGPDVTPGTTTILVKRRTSSKSKSKDKDDDKSSGTNTGGTNAGRTNCGGGVSAGPNTSCPFALNTAATYYDNPGPVIDVYSPVTDRVYTMSCTSGSPHVCTGGNNASVYFP